MRPFAGSVPARPGPGHSLGRKEINETNETKKPSPAPRRARPGPDHGTGGKGMNETNESKKPLPAPEGARSDRGLGGCRDRCLEVPGDGDPAGAKPHRADPFGAESVVEPEIPFQFTPYLANSPEMFGWMPLAVDMSAMPAGPWPLRARARPRP